MNIQTATFKAAFPVLTIIARIAAMLGHGCSPCKHYYDIEWMEREDGYCGDSTPYYTSLEALWLDMDRAADADNADDYFGWAKPWPVEGDMMRHITGSGRMKVSATENYLLAELFSPSFVDGGDRPFAQIEIVGRDIAVSVYAEFDFFYGEKAARLDHVDTICRAAGVRRSELREKFWSEIHYGRAYEIEYKQEELDWDKKIFGARHV